MLRAGGTYAPTTSQLQVVTLRSPAHAATPVTSPPTLTRGSHPLQPHTAHSSNIVSYQPVSHTQREIIRVDALPTKKLRQCAYFIYPSLNEMTYKIIIY